MYGEEVTLTATVAPAAATGTVTFYDGGSSLGSGSLSSGVAALSTSALSVGSHSLTATYGGDGTYDGSTSPAISHTVNRASTSVALASAPDPSVVGETITLTATVTATPPGSGAPTGTVTFTYGSGTVLGAAELVGSGTSTSQAVLDTDALPVGTHTVTATYQGSGDYVGSAGTDSHTVSKRNTITTVFVSDTPLIVGDIATGTVVVEGVPGDYLNSPTGTVTLSHTGTGTLSPTSFNLTAAHGGRFEFTYTATDATAPHVITANYPGDTLYNSSNDTFSQAVEKRQADMVMNLSTTTAYIYQPVTVTVAVADDTTAGSPSVPAGTVTFSDGGKSGVFSLDSTTLSAGQCTVTYTPHENDAGVIAITATYAGSAVYDGASIAEDLVAELRPTRVTVTGSTNPLYVHQSYDFTVTVEDIAGSGTGTSPDPTGSLAYSSTLPPADVQFTPTSGSAPSATFSYLCRGLDSAQGYDIVKATYTPNDGIHAAPEGSENNRAFGQGVRRRDTVTSITNVLTSSSGATFTSETVEKPGLGPTPYPLAGTLTLLAPNTAAGAHGPAATLSHDFTVTSASPLLNVTVQYEPTDRVHLASFGSANIDRSSYYDPGVLPDNPTDYDNCTDGCGTGGTNVENAIYALNSTEVALTAAKMALDAVALVLDVIPDPLTAAGCVVVTGATIPASDIAAAIVAGAGIAIDIAIAAMDTDLDDDGIPDSIES
ncbi:MAG: Ig-like domain-containing protein, partial [Candidatus Bipolaricaulis sp.]|nr:Ig-like domain-containing protein [Candidatus Bipolaricaulis sp.]